MIVNLTFILKKLVKKNPEIYYDFKKNLEPTGIMMPEIEQINWEVFNDDDWKLIEDVVKDTPIRDAINEEYVAYLEVTILFCVDFIELFILILLIC